MHDRAAVGSVGGCMRPVAGGPAGGHAFGRACAAAPAGSPDHLGRADPRRDHAATASGSIAPTVADCSAFLMERAMVSIVCAYLRMASRAPSSPQPAMYGIVSPATSSPSEPSTQ